MFIQRAGALVGFVLLVGCGSEEPRLEGADALSRLGVPEADAQRYALDSLATGQPYGVVATAGAAFKSLADDDRAEVIETVAEWARDYFESDLFEAAYAEHRAGSRPTPREYQESVDEEAARRASESLQQIEQSRTSVVSMLPEADQAELLENLEAMKAQLEDPSFLIMQREGIEMQRAAEQRQFDEALVRWEADLPEHPNELVARRLRAFLDSCGDVDFDAELVEQYGRLRFADAAYERKPWEWKLCFRAGETSVAAARAAAAEWLDTLD